VLAPRGSSLLAGLTPEQIQAVTCGTGPLLLIAGPGAGKTPHPHSPVLLSSFRSDRSGFTDAMTLATSGFESAKALIVYGFADLERSLSTP
jgi:hypothetical protein